MKRCSIITLLLLPTFILPAVVLAQDTIKSQQTTKSLQAEGGDYFVQGIGMDGTDYAGGLEILHHGVETYLLSWQFANPFYGIGLLQADVLSAAYGGPDCILAAYEVQSNGDLNGSWATFSAATRKPEVAVLQQSADTVNTYAIAGANPDGSQYTGTMTLTLTGNTAHAVQVVGNTQLTGTAIRQGSVLSVAFGGQNCGVINYLVQDDGSLSGIWTMNGAQTLAAENAFPVNISGAHNVSGTNPNGSKYTGTLEVAASNQVHTFTWNINGDIPGVGILRGSMVAVGFGGQQCSVASYFILPDGTLNGLWTYVGQNVVGTEVASRSDKPIIAAGAFLPNVDGSYSVIRTLPGDTSGQTYQGLLQVIPRGDVYQFAWDINGASVEGIGIQIANFLFVGYGGDTCGVSAYRINPDNMEGVWGVYGSDLLGTETATR